MRAVENYYDGHGVLYTDYIVGQFPFCLFLYLLFVGVLIMRALLFEVYIGDPDFWKRPDKHSCLGGFPK